MVPQKKATKRKVFFAFGVLFSPCPSRALMVLRLLDFLMANGKSCHMMIFVTDLNLFRL